MLKKYKLFLITIFSIFSILISADTTPIYNLSPVGQELATKINIMQDIAHKSGETLSGESIMTTVENHDKQLYITMDLTVVISTVTGIIAILAAVFKFHTKKITSEDLRGTDIIDSLNKCSEEVKVEQRKVIDDINNIESQIKELKTNISAINSGHSTIEHKITTSIEKIEEKTNDLKTQIKSLIDLMLATKD